MRAKIYSTIKETRKLILIDFTIHLCEINIYLSTDSLCYVVFSYDEMKHQNYTIKIKVFKHDICNFSI